VVARAQAEGASRQRQASQVGSIQDQAIMVHKYLIIVVPTIPKKKRFGRPCVAGAGVW
jgi:hypothetical protein